MLKIYQNIIYIFFQTLLMPISIIGAVYSFQKEKIISKRLKISYTAGQVIQGQWLLHKFKLRRDPEMIKFIKNFPAESHNGFLMMMSAALLANKISGFIPKALVKEDLKKISSYSFLFYRTKKFDQIINQNINNVKQLVILGAGFDLRSIKFNNETVKIFEIDKRNTQDLKIKTLKKASIGIDHVKYISGDLNNNFWADELISNGFQTDKKTLFLFESVSCYLKDDTMTQVLEKINEISPEGSLVAQDFYSTKFLHSDEFSRVKKGNKTVKSFGEQWRFSLDMSQNTEKTIFDYLSTKKLESQELFICGKSSTKSKQPFYAISLAKVI